MRLRLLTRYERPHLSHNTCKVLADVLTMKASKSQQQPKAPRERRERGPPADGIPSKNKVMVANLPYDLTEDKVRSSCKD